MPELPLASTPELRMTKAVIEHTTVVSINTSAAPQSPWRNGCGVAAFECTIGAVPRPASFDSMPRAMPIWIADMTAAPAKPPMAGAGAIA